MAQATGGLLRGDEIAERAPIEVEAGVDEIHIGGLRRLDRLQLAGEEFR